MGASAGADREITPDLNYPEQQARNPTARFAQRARARTTNAVLRPRDENPPPDISGGPTPAHSGSIAHPAIADQPSTRDAGRDQRRAESQPSRGRLHVQEAKSSCLWIIAAHEKYAAGHLAVMFGHPGLLARNVVAGNEIRQNSGDQTFVSPVPAVFLGIENRLTVNDPAKLPHRGVA